MESRKYSKEYMESLKRKLEPSYSTLAQKMDTYYEVVMGYIFLKIREPFRKDEPMNPIPFKKGRRCPVHSTKKFTSRNCCCIKRGPELIDPLDVSAIINELDRVKKGKLQLENVRRELGYEEDVGLYLWKLTECIVEAESIINGLVSILKKRGYVEEEVMS